MNVSEFIPCSLNFSLKTLEAFIMVKSGEKLINCSGVSGRINILCTKCACHALFASILTFILYVGSKPAKPSNK